MLEIENLSKHFESGFSLKQINLHIKPGERISIYGPNGAGKTTFLRILSLLEKPSEGTFTAFGYSTRQRANILANIGFAPPAGHFYETMSVKQNLMFYGKMYGLEKKQLLKRMGELLDYFDLNSKLDQKVALLSKGMKQRLLIIKTVLHDPQLLLLDEPYSGLDMENEELLDNFLNSLKDKTIITATHDLDKLVTQGSRTIIFNNGSVAFDRTWTEDIPNFRPIYRQVIESVQESFNDCL